MANQITLKEYNKQILYKKCYFAIINCSKPRWSNYKEKII